MKNWMSIAAACCTVLFRCCLVDENGRWLLQKRADGKYHSGGLWANACCFPSPMGCETLPQAVSRRLQEELGITGEARELFSFIYYTPFPSLSEYEYDHVFLLLHSGPVTPNPEEIGATRWVTPDQLQQELLLHPEQFCSWFLIAAPRVLALLSPPAENRYKSPRNGQEAPFMGSCFFRGGCYNRRSHLKLLCFIGVKKESVPAAGPLGRRGKKTMPVTDFLNETAN